MWLQYAGRHDDICSVRILNNSTLGEASFGGIVTNRYDCCTDGSVRPAAADGLEALEEAA